ncbi:MAG TPA: hypothetical protein PLN52_01755 [Opitutaceae bacterium]|nr:hypothetical protein [Opitutaceae bacterium]
MLPSSSLLSTVSRNAPGQPKRRRALVRPTLGWKPRPTVDDLPQGTVVCQVRYFPKMARLDVIRSQ